MPVSELISLNPAVLKSIAPKGYLLRVPKGGGTVLAASLQMIPAERRATWRIHTVAGGETLASIGKRYGASAANIVATNNLDSAEASEGDRLLIPAVAKSSPRAVKKSRATSRRSSVSSSKAGHTSPQVLTQTASSKRNRG
jgi:membrane-bound lytic murein transglycosylase D